MFHKMDNYNFWENRADLGFTSCTNDVVLKKLEMSEINKHIFHNARILDIGCGNGISAISICENYNVNIDAFDFSEKLINEAKKMYDPQSLKGTVNFFNLDMLNMETLSKKYDIIISERALINLKDFDEQKSTMIKVFKLLNKGGKFLMCENSMDGLDSINVYREQLNLSIIEPPWHNKYFRESDINSIDYDGVNLEKKYSFTSSYYFLSRVINAYVSKINDKEPEYESDINKIAFLLKPLDLDIGQTKLWVWLKTN